MIKEAFTLKKHKTTGEYHLFIGKFTEEGCTSKEQSICKDMKKENSEKNIFSCKNEQEARDLCATHGRKVCANCIEYLYKTL